MAKYLFLDRDGVINERLPDDYVKKPEQFVFIEGSLQAIVNLRSHFDRILIVTNQQGIGKGLMSIEELEVVHRKMLQELEKAGAHIDAVYFCPDLADANPNCRKPNPAMAMRAKADFPEIDFKRSVIVGDSISDMLFGKRLGMKTVLVRSNPQQAAQASLLTVDETVDSLKEWTEGDKKVKY